MPRRDKTGPIGDGPMTGKGRGICAKAKADRHDAGFRPRLGLGCRQRFGHGYGRGFANQRTSPTDNEEIL